MLPTPQAPILRASRIPASALPPKLILEPNYNYKILSHEIPLFMFFPYQMTIPMEHLNEIMRIFIGRDGCYFKTITHESKASYIYYLNNNGDDKRIQIMWDCVNNSDAFEKAFYMLKNRFNTVIHQYYQLH